MTSNNLKRLVVTALFAALVTIATMVIKIPTIATQGYINIGDTMVFVAAILGGPKIGLVAGGLGSALADILLGYAAWAPWTFVIKAVEGFIVGAFAYKSYKKTQRLSLLNFGIMALAAAWMIFGYYVSGGIMKGFPAAVASIPANIIQGIGSLVITVPLLAALRKVNLPE
jgi:uncharacterized membrane protein